MHKKHFVVSAEERNTVFCAQETVAKMKCFLCIENSVSFFFKDNKVFHSKCVNLSQKYEVNGWSKLISRNTLLRQFINLRLRQNTEVESHFSI